MSSRVDAVEDDDAVYVDVQPGNRGYVDHWLDEDWPTPQQTMTTEEWFTDQDGNIRYDLIADYEARRDAAFETPSFREVAGGWYWVIAIGGGIVIAAALVIALGVLRAVF